MDRITKVGILLSVGFLGLTFLGVRGYNNLMNNREIEKPSYRTVSYATGLTGHVEHTQFSDGSQDVKIYPGLGHRLWDSKLYQDRDGDGDVDRIRQNGAEWKMNRLSKMLIREQDYDKHKKEFDEADEKLQELMERNRK